MALLCAPIPALVLVVVSVMISASFPVSNGQVMTSCTASMISSFTPCINFVTNSSPNGTAPSPTSECCNSFKSLMGDGMDCMCLIITGNVPFQVPINRSLAVSLPRACKMTGVPIQCKGTISVAIQYPLQAYYDLLFLFCMRSGGSRSDSSRIAFSSKHRDATSSPRGSANAAPDAPAPASIYRRKPTRSDTILLNLLLHYVAGSSSSSPAGISVSHPLNTVFFLSKSASFYFGVVYL
ncbi:hypothetical protein SAY87_018969 [Trapa incisa]|uniref:Bifunctional inhibitor/plant lipid transfer protein/seed storage helical domain-containing protein n=1 Tax=Trapa incisa TaxID=236973 RepID=A0AAN7Q1M5_9MYRT|nr:hypothetical protein SAY87_018969 [Trapa incisa]